MTESRGDWTLCLHDPEGVLITEFVLDKHSGYDMTDPAASSRVIDTINNDIKEHEEDDQL